MVRVGIRIGARGHERPLSRITRPEGQTIVLLGNGLRASDQVVFTAQDKSGNLIPLNGRRAR